jgi:hypothetical protein
MTENKGLGPFPGGNNPFTCDFVSDGKRCGEDASTVYRTATVTRLACDRCIAELRSARGLLTSPPVAEVALLELMPARAELLARLALAQEKQSGLMAVLLNDQVEHVQAQDRNVRQIAIEHRLHIVCYFSTVVTLSLMMIASRGQLGLMLLGLIPIVVYPISRKLVFAL